MLKNYLIAPIVYIMVSFIFLSAPLKAQEAKIDVAEQGGKPQKNGANSKNIHRFLFAFLSEFCRQHASVGGPGSATGPMLFI